MDVLGDGNCGYYTLILGLENLGIFDFSFTNPTKRYIPMNRNTPWQYNVMRLRHALQNESMNLVESIFGGQFRDFEWCLRCGIGTMEDITGLSDEFYTDELTQKEYFNGTLTDPDKDFDKFQMSTYWATHVFACFFGIRVIVHMRFGKWNGVTARMEWTTTTIDPTAPVAKRMVMVDGLHKLSDQEFKQMRTVEIMYTTGWVAGGQVEDNHFRLLRRVLCDDITVTSETNSSRSLRDYVRSENEHRHQAIVSQISPDEHADKGSDDDVNESAKDVDTYEGSKDDMDWESEETRPAHRPSFRKANPVSKTKDMPVSKTQEMSKHTITKSISLSKRQKRYKYKVFFENEENTKAFKHKTPTKMLYKPATKEYFIKIYDATVNKEKRLLCREKDEYDIVLIKAANDLPNEWVGPPLGDIGEGTAPTYLATKVVTIHQQHSNRYCLTYSLASALFYCGFRLGSEGLAGMAERISKMHFDQAIAEIRGFMENIVSVIGRPTLFGKRTKTHSRKKRQMTWDELFLVVTPFPTVVIPILPTGEATHAFCVVDDLIFDSTTPFALKLCLDSVKWLFREVVPDMYQVLRFNRKVSPRDGKINEQYRREVDFHWDHPMRACNCEAKGKILK